MKRVMMLLALTPLFFLLVAADGVEQEAEEGIDRETVWVSSDGAALKKERKASSDTITELPVGTALAVIEYKKRWYQVAAPDDLVGWIYRGKISKEPLEADESSGEDDGSAELLGAITGSDIESDGTDTARSVRGLSPEAEEYAKKAGTPRECRSALDQVLAYKTTDDEIRRLLKNAKIGEYAE
ncbi:MAG: SH3 domain-containing protein [Desulfobacterales bacterium]|nr:SH3 domain-containing protein [Desulfobacterales bacterium]